MAEGSNVVGLKYVAEGLDSVLAGARQYRDALQGLEQTSQRTATRTTQAGRATETAWSLAMQKYAEETRRASRAADTAWSLAMQQAAAETKRASNVIETAWSLAMQKAAAETKRASDAAETAWALAMQRAAAEARAAQETAAAQQRVSDAYDNLLDTLNPLAAAQQRYNQQVAAIQAYHQQASSSAEALKADLDALNAAYARAGSPIDQFGNVTGVAGTRANTLGLVLQQTGYQVGDFAVQVQSGTNAFVAFGQQATQLAGLLYLIPGAFGVVAGTVASILIPVVTGVLAYFDRMDEQAQKVSDTFRDELTRSLQAAASAVDEFSSALSLSVSRDVEAAIEQYGRLDAGLRQYLERLQTFRREQAFVGIEDAFGKLMQAPALTGVVDDFRAIQEGIAGVNAEIAYLQVQPDPLGTLALEIANLQKELEFLQYEGFQILGVPPQALQQILDLQTAVQTALSERNADALVSALSQLSGVVNGLAEGPVRTALLGAILDVENQARLLLKRAEDVDGGFRGAAGSVDAMNARLSASLGLVGQLLGAIGRIGFETVALRAETAALQAGRGAGQARIEGEMAQAEARMRQAGPLGVIERMGLAAQRKALEDRLAAQTARDAAYQATLPGRGGGGGGGRSAVDEQAEAFERLRRSIDDTYRAQQMFTEGKAILDAQFADKNSAEYLRLLDLLKQKYPEVAGAANDFGNQLQQISNVMSRSMEDAFMSIIDGSQSAGEAFKGMARTIIAEVVKIMVIRPLVRGILGIFGLSANADGGIFSGGSRMAFANGGAFYGGNVTPFANGGVVSSPTLFPMRNGTGLMGEAGPEAIMPLKRTSSGKLGVVAEGGGGTTVVNQHFHIAANGDESVRRIVRDESPRIAEQAKAAVLDAKRRGGAYGKAF